MLKLQRWRPPKYDRGIPPPWSVDHSPSTRRVCSIRISSAMLVRGVRHDTATRQRIWPSCRSSHCHSRLSVFVSPTTVSSEASTSGRLYRSAFKAADWSDIATRKYSLSGGPPPPMRGVDEVIFQTLVTSPNMRSSAWVASCLSSANGARRPGLSRNWTR